MTETADTPEVVQLCPHCGAQMLAWDDECWICPNEPLPVELAEGGP